MRRSALRSFKTFLVLAYMAMEFSGHKRFVEYTPFGEAKSYYGPNETCRDAISPLKQVLSGSEAGRELESFLFERGTSEGLRPIAASLTGTVVAVLLDGFHFDPDLALALAPAAVEAPARAVPAPAPLLAALSPPVVPAAPRPLLI